LCSLKVATLAAQYGRYSVRVFANTSKHFDFHHHTTGAACSTPDKSLVRTSQGTSCLTSTNQGPLCVSSVLVTYLILRSTGKTTCLNSTNQRQFIVSSVLMT